MKTLVLVVLAVTACGGSKEKRVCSHGAELCGAKGEEAKCASDLRDIKDALGDAYGKTLDCGLEAKSCAEFAGCFVGGLGKGLDKLEHDFDRGVDKVMGSDDRAGGAGDGLDLAACHDFRSTSNNDHISASWEGCSDHVRREVACKPFIDQFECDCLEDGAERWSFTMAKPELGDRDTASRVAKANCKMSFGN